MQDAARPSERTPKQRTAVRDWAVLFGGSAIGVVLLGTAWLAVALKRRREHLAALKADTHVRRSKERDAWKESAKRVQTPSAEELEDSGTGDEPPGEADLRDPREPKGPKPTDGSSRGAR